MTPPPEGTPWWAWLIGVVIAIGLPALTAVMIAQRREVTEIREQVKNTHDTNLRTDLDETRSTAVTASAQATLAAESAHRTERHVEDLVRSIRALEHSMDRRHKITDEAIAEVRVDLDEHLDEVPGIIEAAFVHHANDCPLRAARACQPPEPRP